MFKKIQADDYEALKQFITMPITPLKKMEVREPFIAKTMTIRCTSGDRDYLPDCGGRRYWPGDNNGNT